MRFTLRTNYLAMAILAVFVSQASAQRCGVTIDCDWPVPTVAHWTFDDISTGNAPDEINGNTAVWRGGAGENVGVAGFIDGASQTNDENGGSNEHYQVPLPQLDGANGLTLAIWFNQNVASNANNLRTGLINSRAVESSWGGGNPWGMSLQDNNTPRGFDARISGGTARVDANAPGTNVVPNDMLPDGVTPWPGVIGNVVDEWHHVALTWDGTTGDQKLYYDGELLGEATVEANIGTIVNSTNIGLPGAGDGKPDWFIGEDPCCNNREMTGTFDDAGVWDQALSATDIMQIYDAAVLEKINLSKVEPPLPGDVNLDGFVNGDDFDIIRQNFWQPFKERTDGDLVSNDFIDFADYMAWKQAPKSSPPGAASGVSGAAAVPEPSSVLLLIAGSLVGFGLLRR